MPMRSEKRIMNNEKWKNAASEFFTFHFSFFTPYWQYRWKMSNPGREAFPSLSFKKDKAR